MLRNLLEHKQRAGVTQDYQLTAEQLKSVVADFKKVAKTPLAPSPHPTLGAK